MADKSFSDLGLPTQLVAALSLCGYDRPSPVQQAAIPLGRLGSDLIVQAKSGTGKTVVFASILMERIKADVAHVQVGRARPCLQRAAAQIIVAQQGRGLLLPGPEQPQRRKAHMHPAR